MTKRLEFGIVGLGKIGENLALAALEKGMRVVGFNREGASDESKKAGLTEVRDTGRFHDELAPPRILFLYVPAGTTVDDLLEELAGVLDAGDRPISPTGHEGRP